MQPRQRGRPKSFHNNQEQKTIKSLDRSIDVLVHLAKHGSQTLTEVAKSLDQSPATVYRVLSTFEARGLVDADSATQTWSIGLATFRIGSAFLRRTNLVERASPVMRRLMEATGETANLGIRSGTKVIFVSQVETHHSIRAFFPPGTVSPMHASGIGKAILSAMSEDEVRQLIGPEELTSFTPKTLSDLDSLIEDLADSNRRGYCLDDEERTEGMRCIAAPILDAHGIAEAGISVSGPAHRIGTAEIRRFGELVQVAAKELSDS